MSDFYKHARLALTFGELGSGGVGTVVNDRGLSRAWGPT
jgi:hypothetical protein